MLTANESARLAVVLVGARNPSNIGAAARAMQDFGFSDLRIVNPFAAPFEAAQLEADGTGVRAGSGEILRNDLPASPPAPQSIDSVPKSAVGAASVMTRARRFDDLAAAVADCTLVAGTTAIGGRVLERPILSLQQAATRLLGELRDELAPSEVEHSAGDARHDRGARVALLFGSEKTGLTNLQLSHCSLLLNIPLFAPGAAMATGSGTNTSGSFVGLAAGGATSEDAAPRHLSMNLGQAVAVCLYELTRSGFEHARELPLLHEAAATGGDRERLTQLLLELMQATGYARRFPAHSRETVVRHLAQQLGTTHDEATTWTGILRQALRREAQSQEG